MNLLMLIALIAIGVAGLAAILGIWVERDPNRPKIFAFAISVVIVLATGLTVIQAYMEQLTSEKQAALDAAANDKLQGDLARMMQTLDKLAADSEDPALLAFLSTELEAQARANPEVINKIAQREADEGRDPAKMLGKHLTGSEMEKIARSGKLKTKPKASEKDKDTKSAESEKTKEEKKRSNLPAALRAARGAAKPGGGGLIPGLGAPKDEGDKDGNPKPSMGPMKLGGRGDGDKEEGGASSGGMKLPGMPKGDDRGGKADKDDKAPPPPPPMPGSKGKKGKKGKKSKSKGKGGIGGLGGFGKPGGK